MRIQRGKSIIVGTSAAVVGALSAFAALSDTAFIGRLLAAVNAAQTMVTLWIAAVTLFGRPRRARHAATGGPIKTNTSTVDIPSRGSSPPPQTRPVSVVSKRGDQTT
jgi:hypothetical protein